jgi:hypothetical protein
MSAPLCVGVLARDEVEELERCLGSVGWADEVVVLLDSRGSEACEAVARKLASRVEKQPYAGDLAQKRACTALASHDWVLLLDADEVVTPELARSIRAALQRPVRAGPGDEDDVGRPEGYRVNRATYHLGRWIRHGDFFPDWKLRLFRRSQARWAGRDPHGRIDVEGRVEALSGELLHYSYRDLADQIQRIQRFSDQASAALVEEGIPFRLHRLLLRPPARFLRCYVLRRGFLDGLPGLVIAVASAFYVFLKYAKLWERTRMARDGIPRA